MKFQYSEKKVKLPENVHAYAEKKVMKLARFFEEDAEALIVFSVEKNRNNVELTVHGAGTWFRASESTSDMFASIDAAVGTIEGQIRKNKTRLARRLRQDAMADRERLRRNRPRLRFAKKVAAALMEEACQSLGEAKAMHDHLESLYHPYVDFDAVSRLADTIADEIFSVI